MASLSQNLGLIVPTPTDPFSTADIAQNWEKIDDAPGTYICTSTTRPTFTASQPGRRIYEKDTDLEWTWSGTEWQRVAPMGLLKRTNGEWATGTVSTDVVSSASTYVIVCSVTNVVVPAGRRTLQVQVVWSRAYNTLGYFYGAIFRSAVNNSGTRIGGWAITGANRSGQHPDEGGGGSTFALERDGLPPGVYDWSFQIATQSLIGGTSTVQGNPTSPNSISILEL